MRLYEWTRIGIRIYTKVSRSFVFGFALLSVLAISVAARATEFTSTDFQALDPVIFPAGYSTSSSYALWSTISQIAIGTSTSDMFEVRSGFLYFPAPAAAPSPTPAAASAPIASGNITGSIVVTFLRTFLPPVVTPIVVRPCTPITDLNCDGRVGLTDLSIFLYLSEKPALAIADFNSDGKVGVGDISVMFFDWTERLFTVTGGRGESPVLITQAERPVPLSFFDLISQSGPAAVEEFSSRAETQEARAVGITDILDVWKRAFFQAVDIFIKGVNFLQSIFGL